MEESGTAVIWKTCLSLAALLIGVLSTVAEARVVRVRVEHRELILDGKPFALAGPYEKLFGTVEFSLDPASPTNAAIVDLPLAPRNQRGEVEFSADFYLLKPLDPS